MFSFAHNSCSRNHRRYTLCGLHSNEEHAGDWKNCTQCREGMNIEMYVYFGTNEYNFEALPDPPAFEPTKCADCGKVIVLGDSSFSCSTSGYRCDSCTARIMSEMVRSAKGKSSS